MKALPLLLLLSTSIAEANPRVTIESDNDEISLNQVTNEAHGSAWGSGGTARSEATESHMVCRAPCNQTVSGQFKYFIAGDGMPNSRKFLLPADGDTTLKVNTGNSLLHYGGGTLLAFACAGVMTAAIVGFTGDPDTGKLTVGISVPAAIAGFVMLRTGRTTVQVIRGTGVALDLRHGAFTF